MCPPPSEWPRKVFLESTALFRLGPRLENVDFAELQRFQELIDFELIVAEVSWREYLRRREKEARDCIAKIRQCRADLAKHDQIYGELEEAEKKALAHLDHVSQHFLGKVESFGIIIAPTPAVNIHMLLEMSLTNEPPFEDSQSDSGEKTKEKGFRDALILFTVLENIKNQPQEAALIVTNDTRLGEAFRVQGSKLGMKLDVVQDLQKANLHIDATLDAWYRGVIKREADEAKGMLLRYHDQLSERIQEIKELTESELGQGPLAALSGDETRLDIQELRSLAFDDVESALWKDRDKDKSRILFRVRCRARVIARERPGYFSWNPTSFSVGGGKTSVNRLAALASLNTPSIEKDLPVSLYGEAQLERQNEDWQLVGLKVDKSLPEPEWIELQRLVVLTKGID